MHTQPGGAPPPVFVDRTGRRRRLTVIAGTAMGLGLLTSLGLILAGLFFDSSVPIPGWSETKVQPPIEAGVDGPGPRPTRTGTSPHPTPVTSTTAPRPSAAPTVTRTAPRPTTAAPQPSVPGQGDQKRNTARPSRSPGKP